MPTLIPEFTHTPSRQNPATFSSDMDSRLSEENSRIIAMNAQSVENNAAVTSTSTAASNALAYSNNAATSATQAQTAANLATAVVIPTAATYSYTQQDWRQSMMSKAEFNAVAKQESRNNAGSGFIEFGKHNNSPSTYPNVNEGIWTSATAVNNFNLGSPSSNGIGTSKTDDPFVCVNGIVHRIDQVATSLATLTTVNNKIYLPPAPTVLPSTATLTQQQIDSGVIKHADASNSGLLLNGRNLVDTSGWLNGVGSHAVSSGKLEITNGTSIEGYDSQSYVTVIGKKYKLEIVTTDGTSLSNSIKVGNSIGASTLVNLSNVTTATRTEVEFTATATLTYLTLGTGTTVTGETALFGEIGIFPADAISHSDLVFLESWHEDISEKGVVYRYGNVQFKGASESAFGTQVTPSAGTPVFAGYGTYSLFSDTWQADEALIGNCYIWANMTDVQKKAFVADPENNSYLDGDKVIQVRYRIRDVMGDSDIWVSYDTYGTGALTAGTSRWVQVKGKNVSVVSDVSNSSTVLYYNGNNTNVISLFGVQVGNFSASPYTTTVAYEGKCFALPIALVHRRNTGMMHPVYNPNGTKLASDSLPWYSTTVSFTSIADCFTDSKLLTASGYIGTTTGRADGIFFDQCHEADITDLRMSSKVPTDYNRLIDKEFNRLVAGTYRGTEGEKYTESKVQTTTGTVATVEVNDGTKYKSGDTIYIYDLTASVVKGRFTIKSISTNTLTVDVAFAKLANNYLISGASSTRTKSNTITVYDVIGNPANYPADWKTWYASLTSLHTAEDGTSLLPTGTTGSDGLAVFKLSRKANATPLQVLKSTDSGVTWTALAVTTHYTFSTTTNAITFTAGNIPLTTDLIRVTYQTHTNMAVAAVNSEVLAINNGIASNYYNNSDTNLSFAIASTLIGKVPVSIASGTVRDSFAVNAVLSSSSKLGASYSTDVRHGQITLTGVSSPTVKVFHYLTRSNGKAYLQLVFKEMKYGSYAAPTVVTAASATYTQNMTYKINIAGCALDGKVIQWTAATATGAVDWSLYDVSPTGVIYLLSSGAVYASARLYDGDSWGDDSKFNIVDNVSTTTDTNGATVLIGQKRVELPYFIGASE